MLENTSYGLDIRKVPARALANDDDILLMDEAFSALDPLNRTDMGSVLLRLQAGLRKTIIFITFDLVSARQGARQPPLARSCAAAMADLCSVADIVGMQLLTLLRPTALKNGSWSARERRTGPSVWRLVDDCTPLILGRNMAGIKCFARALKRQPPARRSRGLRIVQRAASSAQLTCRNGRSLRPSVSDQPMAPPKTRKPS